MRHGARGPIPAAFELHGTPLMNLSTYVLAHIPGTGGLRSGSARTPIHHCFSFTSQDGAARQRSTWRRSIDSGSCPTSRTTLNSAEDARPIPLTLRQRRLGFPLRVRSMGSFRPGVWGLEFAEIALLIYAAKSAGRRTNQDSVVVTHGSILERGPGEQHQRLVSAVVTLTLTVRTLV